MWLCIQGRLSTLLLMLVRLWIECLLLLVWMCVKDMLLMRLWI